MASLKFGTSGLRGLVVDLDTAEAFRWVCAFCAHLKASGQAGSGVVLIGQDLRSSSPSIAERAAAAVKASGFEPVHCGALPTPALAMEAMARGGAAIMVTGSHIPDDRNGLKFYVPGGEIDKADEAAIRAAYEQGAGQGENCEARLAATDTASAGDAALQAYIARYVDFFGSAALSGLTVAVYEQSSVARDALVAILNQMGAQVISLARASTFIPVDTEAHRPEDVALIRDWALDPGFDALVSTDGDADRPLVAAETGAILRGDVLGMLVARQLKLATIVTPVTSASSIETSGLAQSVIRTKVGSPFVIAGMRRALDEGRNGIVGFEANGGVLIGSEVRSRDAVLPPLWTRDAVLPILCALLEMKDGSGKRPLSDVVASLNAGFTAANRLQEINQQGAARFLQRLADDAAYRNAVLADIGQVSSVDTLDGVRMLLDNGICIHFRASGNAPELRCYIEAPDQQRADALLGAGLAIAERELASLSN